MEASGVQEYIYNDRDKQPPAFLKKLNYLLIIKMTFAYLKSLNVS